MGGGGVDKKDITPPVKRGGGKADLPSGELQMPEGKSALLSSCFRRPGGWNQLGSGKETQPKAGKMGLLLGKKGLKIGNRAREGSPIKGLGLREKFFNGTEGGDLMGDK